MRKHIQVAIIALLSLSLLLSLTINFLVVQNINSIKKTINTKTQISLLEIEVKDELTDNKNLNDYNYKVATINGQIQIEHDSTFDKINTLIINLYDNEKSPGSGIGAQTVLVDYTYSKSTANYEFPWM